MFLFGLYYVLCFILFLYTDLLAYNQSLPQQFRYQHIDFLFGLSLHLETST